MTEILSWANLENLTSKEQRAEMTSNAASESGSGPDRTLPADTANHDFTLDGFDPGGSRGMIWDLSDFMSAGEITALESDIYITYTLTKDFNSDETNSSTLYPISFDTVSGWVTAKTDGDHRNRIAQGDGQNGGPFSIAETGKTESEGLRFDLIWNSSQIYLYVNYLLCDMQGPGIFAAGFSNMYVGGLTTTAGDFEGKRIRDVQLSKTPPSLNFNTVKVLHLGTSITCQGGPPLFFSTPSNDSLKLPWIATNNTNGCGYTSSGYGAGDTNQFSTGSYRDAGMIPTIYRELGRKNIFPYDDNRNHAQSGGTVASAITQVSNISSYEPTVVICELGANDAAQLVADATFQTNYETLIDDLFTLGADKIVLTKILPLSADSTYASSTYYDDIDSKNTIIDGLVTYAKNAGYGASYVSVVSVSAFGSRENFTTGFWQSEGELTEVSISAAGSGYSVSDVLTCTGGDGSGATITVSTIDGGGGVTGVTISAAGSNYTTPPTGYTGGSGTGATFGFQIGNIHPNERGSYELGMLIGAGVSRALGASAGGSGSAFVGMIN